MVFVARPDDDGSLRKPVCKGCVTQRTVCCGGDAYFVDVAGRRITLHLWRLRGLRVWVVGCLPVECSTTAVVCSLMLLPGLGTPLLSLNF